MLKNAESMIDDKMISKAVNESIADFFNGAKMAKQARANVATRNGGDFTRGQVGIKSDDRPDALNGVNDFQASIDQLDSLIKTIKYDINYIKRRFRIGVAPKAEPKYRLSDAQKAQRNATRARNAQIKKDFESQYQAPQTSGNRFQYGKENVAKMNIYGDHGRSYKADRNPLSTTMGDTGGYNSSVARQIREGFGDTFAAIKGGRNYSRLVSQVNAIHSAIKSTSGYEDANNKLNQLNGLLSQAQSLRTSLISKRDAAMKTYNIQDTTALAADAKKKAYKEFAKNYNATSATPAPAQMQSKAVAMQNEARIRSIVGSVIKEMLK